MFKLNKITMDLVIFARTCNYSSGIYNELNISIFYICNRKIINCMTKDELGIKVNQIIQWVLKLVFSVAIILYLFCWITGKR